MFCPQCKTEYREGFKLCADCGAELINRLPIVSSEEKQRLITRPPEWVTVLESFDAGIIMVAKSILEGAGIRYFARGEDLQDLFGIGKITFNPLMGTVKIQVDKQDAEVAQEFLQELSKEK